MTQLTLVATPAPRARFARDARGSILIAGLCMGIILVLGCMHIIDAAEAALARMVGQNAADAIALEGAVWHAQGMNLIVFINLIMAAVMALFIAIRVTELLLAAAIVITAIALAAAIVADIFFGAGSAAIPVLQQFLRAFGQAEKEVVKLEQRVSNPIFTTLAYAANTERLVAAAFPYVSVARPITNSAGLDGVALATSLLPSFLDNTLSKAPNVPIFKDKDGKSVLVGKGGVCHGDPKDKKDPCKGFEVESSMPARMGTIPQPTLVKYYVSKLDKKLPSRGRGAGVLLSEAISGGVGSLPVQEEDFYAVCGRAAEFMAAVFGKVFGTIGLDTSSSQRAGDLLAVTFGSLQKIACTPMPQVTKKLTAQVEKARTLFCEQKQKDFTDDPANKDKKWDDKKQKDCEADAKKKGKIADPVDPESIKIARLWGFTASPANSPFLHVWATAPVPGRFPIPTAKDKGEVEPANAVGEFRHVCDGNIMDAARRGCAENSMFSPGWYGKLVPVRSLGTELVANLGEIAAGWLGRAIGKSITGVVDMFFKTTGKKYAESVTRMFGSQYGALAVGSKAANGWWNRRLLSGEMTRFLTQPGSQILTAPEYPECLH